MLLCKNLPTIFSGTYKSYICCVNNDGGSRNCLCKLTLRLKGRQGRCGLILYLYFPIVSNIIVLSHNNFHLNCPVLHYLDCSVAGALAAEVREAVESKIETYHLYSLCFHLVTTCNPCTFLTSHQHS